MKTKFFMLGTAFCVLALFSAMFNVAQPKIVAQAQEATQEIVEEKPAPLPPASDFRKKYLIQLSNYRDLEQKFLVAKEQYTQLQTLASLEDAVKALKAALLARTDTLMAYIQTLKATLVELKGVELTKKADEEKKVGLIFDELEKHRTDIESAVDKVNLNKVADTFAKNEEKYTAISYETLALVRIGSMQSAVDQLQATKERVKELQQEVQLAPEIRAEKDRGFDELERTLDEVRASIAQATEFHDRFADGFGYDNSGYTQVTTQLSTGYTKLRQAENFLKELAKQ